MAITALGLVLTVWTAFYQVQVGCFSFLRPGANPGFSSPAESNKKKLHVIGPFQPKSLKALLH